MKYMTLLTILVYCILLLVLVINIYKKNRWVKYISALFTVVFLLTLFVINENFCDQVLFAIIRYIYFPEISSYIVTTLLTSLILFFTIIYDRFSNGIKVVNYTFSFLIIVSYIIFLMLEINVNSYNQLYVGNSLICLRLTTMSFVLWILTLAIVKYFNYLKR